MTMMTTTTKTRTTTSNTQKKKGKKQVKKKSFKINAKIEGSSGPLLLTGTRSGGPLLMQSIFCNKVKFQKGSRSQMLDLTEDLKSTETRNDH